MNPPDPLLPESRLQALKLLLSKACTCRWDGTTRYGKPDCPEHGESDRREILAEDASNAY